MKLNLTSIKNGIRLLDRNSDSPKILSTNHNYLLSSWIMCFQTTIIIASLLIYGISLLMYKQILRIPILNKILLDHDLNFMLQGTIAAFFPIYGPKVFFGIYLFAYRIELFFIILQNNRNLRKRVISFIQTLRKSSIKSLSLIGRVASLGFMGGAPKMPGGSGGGLIIWGVVVVSSVAINQYRLYRKDMMAAQNEASRDRMKAQNEAYKIQTEASNKCPWFGSKPPEPPKF